MSSLDLFNNAVPVEVLFDCDNQQWFKRAHVGKFLELEKILMSTKGLDNHEMCTRNAFEATLSNPYPWSGPKDQQNKTDVFLSVYGVMHVIVNSRKGRGKELKEFILKDIIPRGLNEKIKQLQENHQLAITDRDNKIQAIQYENVGLQGEIRAKDHQIA